MKFFFLQPDSMFVASLSDVPLENSSIVFLDCASTAVFNKRVHDANCTGFAFDRFDTGFPAILCADKVEWMNALDDHVVIYVTDDWDAACYVQEHCSSVTPYFVLNLPALDALFCLFLFALVIFVLRK